ncbi:hypothetical protein [Actinocatenispora rupis]|uniref:Uncharacterized protein n=1 Tax=Actinocatenispora rupis TaxID=519421 RepID=A0A8J3J2U0_9ACTN|nr:hypothetical protein [Actinocatenispora rupis]GID10546.1 hypothetical protein Aru02nite_14350 [Actinocatenispora rupis]
MDVDPGRNHVVFAVSDGEGPVIEVPARADDALRQAWLIAVREHGVVAHTVREVFTEWEPSPADGAFLELTFPGVPVGYAFPRPADGDWDAAYAAARRTIEARAAEARPAAAPPADDDGMLLPILRTTTLPGASATLDVLPHRHLVPGRLAVTLARVAPTPHGTIGMSHLTYAQLGADDFDALLATAYAGVQRGLTVTGLRADDSDLIRMSREGWLAGSAVALPDFHRYVSGLLGADDLVVAVPCPDDLYVTAAGSGCVPALARMVAEAPQQTGEYLPSLLRVTANVVEVLAEGTPG